MAEKDLRDSEEGLILSIKVTPNAKKNEIVGWHDGCLKVRVCAPPEKGEANKALVDLLSKTLQLPKSKIVLLKGATSRKKEYLLIGFVPTEDFFSL